ncbi:LPS export ABC transporter permease LptG [Rhodobacteraceae bacterium NNCM2]|nr:LPS export ABC transporter permease LptG [Coraliihabitans acroporae]
MRWTLNLYIARVFLTFAIFAFLAVFALIMIVDLVELMRENKRGGADFTQLLGMAFLHAPSVTIKAAPFTILLSSMICFATLAHRSELVVTRAAGVSALRLISPALITAGLLGIAAFTVYNPIASSFAERFEHLQEQYFDKASSSLTVSADGVWLRQGDEMGQTVVRAQRASGSVERLWDVNVFQFDNDDRLFRRIDARSAQLEPDFWRLSGVAQWTLDRDSSPVAIGDVKESIATTSEEVLIPTDLTSSRIAESFAAPETISFWSLPGFIALLEKSGFSSDRHWMHLISLLSTPVVFVAMVLIGAAFSMRHARFGGLGVMALGCVLTGFGYFFLSDVTSALGASGAVPVMLAGWAPPFAAVLLALGLLLHLEDG